MSKEREIASWECRFSNQTKY